MLACTHNGADGRKGRKNDPVIPFFESYGGKVKEHESRKRGLVSLAGSGWIISLFGLLILTVQENVDLIFPSLLMIVFGVIVFFGALAGIFVLEYRFRASIVASSAELTSGREGLCVHCNMPVTIRGSEFCPSCGARLIGLADAEAFLASSGEAMETRPTPAVSAEQASRIARAFRVRKRERLGNCMVCNLHLKRSDPIAWCPHCGNPAHKNHLIRWIETKRICPMCGQHLDELELVQYLSQTSIDRATKGA
jgi:Zn finger protein HypA/HybF involved in hydrogenase expression